MSKRINTVSMVISAFLCALLGATGKLNGSFEIYFVSIQKRLSGKWRVYVTKQKESDHGNFSTPITYKITASTVKETLEYWLIRLKSYFLGRRSPFLIQ